jgi:NAD(P)H dehydrogenase (quinone)
MPMIVDVNARGWVAMVKVLVLYDSRSGNTEKMALAVVEGVRQVKNVDVVLKKVTGTSLDDLEWADGIIVGSPTFYGLMSGNLKVFFDESVKIHGKLAGKVGGAFTSSGGAASGAETTLLSILEAMLIHGMVVQGNSDREHYGAAARGSPNNKAIDSCRELGNRVASLTSKLAPTQRNWQPS